MQTRVIYSFNKHGFEERFWTREIAAASNGQATFIPFNHGAYLDPNRYVRAQLLDNLYYRRDPDLLRMYSDLERRIREEKADVLIADNFFPYHPEFLRALPVYKVLRTTDGPLAAYDRDFAYLHAYDHVLYHTPAYSPELTMREKLAYCGARRFDFWPLALFDAAFDPARSESDILGVPRDIDIIFIGALYPDKMALLARVRKAFGRRFRIHGLTSVKKNLYFNLKHGFPGWVTPVRFEQYVPLYQRSAIGINVHLRAEFTVGSYRLFELPGNGVMQISDGGEHLNDFFEVGKEIVGYRDADDLVDQLEFYLRNDEARQAIALAGHRRALRDHRFRHRMIQAVALIRSGLQEVGR